MKILLPCIFIILLFGCNHKAEKAELTSKIEALTSQKDSLTNLTNQLQIKLDSINKEIDFWYDNQVEGKELSEMGIKDPKQFIIQSLMKKPELIPIQGVLGGQMKFMQVQLLGKECLIAYYEDGHTNGRAFYSYKLNNGQLDFKLIASYLE
ncbi:MAG: hypothetical protein ACM3PR_13705 [Bacteroidales bacterium]